MHTADRQIELYVKLHNAGYLTALPDVNEMTEQEIEEMISA